MKVRLRVEGVKDLDNALKSLSRATQKRVLVRALTKGGELIAEEARALVPVRTGNLRDSIEVSTKLNDRQDRVTTKESRAEVYVGPRSGGGDPDGYYGHMVEFGTSAGAKGGRNAAGRKVYRTHPGNPPQPFLRPAFDAKEQQALGAIADELRSAVFKSIDRRARREAKRQARRTR